MLPIDLQTEQMMNVMGIDAQTGEPLPDYRGRTTFGEFTAQVPLPGGQFMEIPQPATLGGYAANLGWTAKRLPNGSIVEGKGLNLDSGLGSFHSGLIDAFGELATDPTLLAQIVAKQAKVLGLSVAAYNKLSPAARGALEGETFIQRFLKAGATIDDIPLTSRSWAEVEQLRVTFADEVGRLDQAVSDGRLSAAERDSLFAMKSDVLANSETQVWDADRLSEMIRTDKRWQFVFGLIDDAKSKAAGDADTAAFLIRNKVFKNRISLEDAKALALANGQEGYRQVFLEAANGLKRGEKTLPDTIQELTVSTTGIGQIAPNTAQRLQRAKAGVGQYYERMVMSPPVAGLSATKGGQFVGEVAGAVKTSPLAKGITDTYARIRNLFSLAPEAAIVVDGSVGQRMASVDSAVSFAKGLFPLPEDEQIVVDFAARVQKHMSENMMDVERINPLGDIETVAVRASQTRAGVRAVEEEIYGMIETFLVRDGHPPSKVKYLMGTLRKARQKVQTWTIDDAGFATDYGALQRMGDYGLADLKEVAREMSETFGVNIPEDQLRIIGAATAQDLYNHVLVLPDIKQVKAMSQNPFFRKLIRDADGEKRFAVQLVDALNLAWKQTTLANIGYLSRNLLDGQTALWAGDTGIYTMFHKPYRFWRIIRNKAGVEDILNNPMTTDQIRALSQRMVDELTPSEKQLLSIGRVESWGTYKEKTGALQRMIETGDIVRVTKQNQAQYPTAVVQAVRKIHADPMERILAQVAGISDPIERKSILMEWLLSTDEGQFVQTQILDAYKTQGVRIGLPNKIVAGLEKVQKLDLETKTDRLAFWDSLIDTMISGRVDRMAEVPELRAMMSHNVVPKLDESGRAIIESYSLPSTTKFYEKATAIPANRAKAMENITGALWTDSAGKQFYVVSAQKTTSGWDVKLLELDELAGSAWIGRQGEVSNEALMVSEKLFARPELVDNLPETLPFFVERDLSRPERLARRWQNGIDKIFIGGFGTVETVFEKLPPYRQFKWQEYANNYGSLSAAELRRAERNVVLGAKRFGMSVDDYMGGATRGAKATGQGPFAALQAARKKAVEEGRTAGYTLEQLDAYASSVANYKMRQFLYDAPKKFNIETVDGLEWFFTFIAAQRSIMQRFVRLAIANPDKPYRIARAFNGSQDLNLPGDYENGMTYWDPVTNQWKFRHPLGFLARSAAQAAGVDLEQMTPYIGSPIKGFSVGFTGLPNVAPLGAVALNFVLDTVSGMTDADQQVDAFRRTFMPFELLNKDKSTLDRLTPAVIYKAIQLFESIAMNKKTALIDKEIGDAARALFTTGNYDLNDRASRERFDRDSQLLAQTMAGFSIASQFFGPAAGTPEYTVNIKGVDMNAAALSEERQRLLDLDYETGNMKFYSQYGEQVLLYMVGKTTSVKNAKGFMMTEKYVDWVKQNEFDLANYDTGVGYYFGPADEDEFSFGSRAYLFDKQLTRYRGALELMDAAKYSIASMKYRIYRNTFKTYLTEDDQAGLKSYREKLKQQYGYTGPQFNPNELPDILDDIDKIIREGGFKDSPIIDPLRKYMFFRKSLLEANGRSTFRSKAMTGARQELDAEAERLIALGNPEFQRLYDRVLSQETDPAGMDEENYK
jgi:hypothetical protein